jgi:DNA-directed RNA polymerase specialized sigma24 family protein
MHPPDERDLLHRCLAGDRRAWTTLVESLTRYVYYLIRLTARRHATEFTDEEMADLHNDLFLALFEDNCRRLRAWRGDNGCTLRSWIRVITIRRTIDALRRRRRHISLDAPADDPLAAAALRINKGALYTRKTRLIKRLRALAAALDPAPDTPPTQDPPTHEPR